MKNLVLILLLLLTAPCAFAYDYSQMCMKEPYPVSGAVPRFFSNVSGMNFLLTRAAESQVEKALKKDLSGKFKVDIVPFGAKNFMDGKFKSMIITSKNLMYSGANFSDFHAETVCGYNQIIYKNNKEIYFPENVLFKFSGVITSEDFSKTVMSEQYYSALNKMNVSIANRVIFRIFDPSAKIENDRINMSFKVMTPFVFTSEISDVNVNAGLAVENGRIVFTDMDLGSSNSKLNLTKMLPIINKLNPLTYEHNVSKNTKGITKISNIKVANSKIYVDGLFIIPKNYATTK